MVEHVPSAAVATDSLLARHGQVDLVWVHFAEFVHCKCGLVSERCSVGAGP